MRRLVRRQCLYSLLPFFSTLPARARVAGLLPRPLVLLLCCYSLLLEHGFLKDADYEGRGRERGREEGGSESSRSTQRTQFSPGTDLAWPPPHRCRRLRCRPCLRAYGLHCCVCVCVVWCGVRERREGEAAFAKQAQHAEETMPALPAIMPWLCVYTVLGTAQQANSALVMCSLPLTARRSRVLTS